MDRGWTEDGLKVSQGWLKYGQKKTEDGLIMGQRWVEDGVLLGSRMDRGWVKDALIKDMHKGMHEDIQAREPGNAMGKDRHFEIAINPGPGSWIIWIHL
jgi:hypothetical protein